MVNKKILLGVGILAALALGYFAFFGWPPMESEDTSGAIGAAKKYRSEQIADADVVLQDADIQALLQTDFFYQMVTNEDFRKFVADGTLGKVMMLDGADRRATPKKLADLGKLGVEDAVFRQSMADKNYKQAVEAAGAKGVSLDVADLARLDVMLGDGLRKFTAEDWGRVANLANDGAFKAAVSDGDYDKAAKVADVHKLTVKRGDLAKFDVAGLGKRNVRVVDGLGKSGVLADAGFRQAVIDGNNKQAIEAAGAKGVSLDVADLNRLHVAGFGKFTPADWDAMGRLTRADGFGKVMVSDGFDKLMKIRGGQFKQDMAAGDMNRYLVAREPK